MPENEIEFIHNADTEAKKAALFSKVRSGDVRVLLGSTAKMGAGTNVQSRLVAVHHLDVGWKPSDMTQRNGRIIRQGNMNKEVKVFNYVTEGTFDAYLWQTLENKQRFISQIMTSKSPVRSCEDVDEQALSYAEIKALCAGNPLIKEKMDLDVQVAKLKVLKADHQSQKFRLQDKLLTKFPADIQETNAHIAGLKADAQLAAAHPQEKEVFCGMTIKGVTYDEKKTAGERLVLACSELPNAEEKVIGSYRGFELSLRFDTFRTEYQALLKGQRKYTVPLGNDPLGNIIRLDNALNSFPERITAAENELDTLHQQQAAAQIEVEKPFPQEEELAEKSARLAELNAQLDVDEKSHEPEQDEEEQEDSLGMKQRLAIALAVMHDPELLILDEPINGLDPIGIAEVRSFIRELCDARGKTILISSHILSEISLLADDIGIIDHGALLEEESLAELEQKSSKHIRFTISDTAQAARILECNFHETHFSIQDDHNLRLHNMELPVGKIVTAFVENGLEVSEAHTCEESLEDYFKRVTGGEGIA